MLLWAADLPGVDERLSQHRNLGKAFYENPTTQAQAVVEFKKALELAPHSNREKLNYGLALLRAGKTGEGVTRLQDVQRNDPKLPHTWFNLGIYYKRSGEFESAVRQFEQMQVLVPTEPIVHYQLGTLYKLAGRTQDALAQFERAARLDPRLAAARFQLYNMYRQAGRQQDAAEALRIFQELKKQSEGAAIPEDVEWSSYAEIYDPPMTPAPSPRHRRWSSRNERWMAPSIRKQPGWPPSTRPERVRSICWHGPHAASISIAAASSASGIRGSPGSAA